MSQRKPVPEKSLDPAIVAKLFDRYSHIHPLIRHRSAERSRTLGELFDLLDGFPTKMPVIWSEENRKWVETDPLLTRKRSLTESS